MVETALHDGTVRVDLRSGSLRRNFAWSVFGNIGYLAAQWGIISLLAKRMGPDGVGIYSYGLAVTAPIMVLAGMQLRILQATDTKDSVPFSEYLGLRYLSVALGILALLPICIVTDAGPETAGVIVLIGLIKAIDLVSDTCFGGWQKRERMDLIAIARVANGVLTLIGFAVVLLISDSIVSALIVSACVSLLLLFSFTAHWVWRLVYGSGQHRTTAPWYPTGIVAGVLTPTWCGKCQRYLLRMGLPLGITAAIVSLDSSLPRIAVEHELGRGPLGVYSALAYATLVGSTLVDALGNSASPRLARLYNSNQLSAFRALLLKLIAVGLLGTIGAIAFVQVSGEFVVARVFSPEFSGHNNLLVMLTTAAGIQFIGTILGFGLTASRSLNVQVALQGAALLLGLSLYFPFTAEYGLDGVGYAAIAISVFRLLLTAFVSMRSLSSIATS